MAHFHFLIDVSLSNQHFKQHATFSRLMDQIDHLAELNQQAQQQQKVQEIKTQWAKVDVKV